LDVIATYFQIFAAGGQQMPGVAARAPGMGDHPTAKEFHMAMAGNLDTWQCVKTLYPW